MGAAASPPPIPPDLVVRLRRAERVVALTGAGVSAESGVPTFRDALTGLWAKYDPQELATPEAFARDPRLVWDWYAWRRELVADVRPNAGHLALAAWADLVPSFTLITQNVDGLHEKAGSEDVIALHGNIARTRCHACGRYARTFDVAQRPPPCRACGGWLRPDVVWFGEALPADALERAIRASAVADVFLSIGTSSLVHPASALPGIALEAGAALVEVNPDPTPLTPQATYVLAGPSGVVLPALVRSLAAARDA